MSARPPEGTALDTELQDLQACFAARLTFLPVPPQLLWHTSCLLFFISCVLQERLDRQNGPQLTTTSEAVRTAAMSTGGPFSVFAQC